MAYLLLYGLMQFRKFLEGFQKAYRKLSGSCCFMWVAEGSREVYGDRPEAKSLFDSFKKLR